ncbi:hypothetical protein AX16_008892 [Volvariella volvacea WC 439]|nr:hypothetical protein AX16_008892 [Volvariella volvacea WC 439]
MSSSDPQSVVDAPTPAGVESIVARFQRLDITDAQRPGGTPHQTSSVPIPKYIRTIPLHSGRSITTNLLLSTPPTTSGAEVHEEAGPSVPTPGSGSNQERVIASSDDHTIDIYSLPGCQHLRKLQGHTGGVWSLAECRRDGYDLIVSGSTDKTVRVWDVTDLDSQSAPTSEKSDGTTISATHVFPGHSSTVRCVVVVTPEWIEVEKDDGRKVKEKWPKRPLIVSGSRDSTLRVWTLPKPGESVYNPVKDDDDDDYDLEASVKQNPYHRLHLKGHTNAIRDLAAQGRTIVSGSYDNTVRVWDIITGQCQLVLTGHTLKVYCVALDLARNHVYSGSMDGTARIWDLKTGAALHTLTGHTSLVGLLAISSESTLPASSPTPTSTSPPSDPIDSSPNPDSNSNSNAPPSYLVSASADATLRVWNPHSGQHLHTLAHHRDAITCFHHDTTKVVSGATSELKLWDVRTGECVADMVALRPGRDESAAGASGEDVGAIWKVAFGRRWCAVAYHGSSSESSYLDIWDFGVPVLGEGKQGGGDGDEDAKEWEIVEDSHDDDNADQEILRKTKELQGGRANAGASYTRP